MADTHDRKTLRAWCDDAGGKIGSNGRKPLLLAALATNKIRVRILDLYRP